MPYRRRGKTVYVKKAGSWKKKGSSATIAKAKKYLAVLNMREHGVGSKAKKSRDGYKRKVDNKMNYYGDIDFDKKVIRVNKKRAKKSGKKGELLDTLVHEENHRKSPRAHEKTIKKKTDADIKRMSKKTKAKHYRTWGKKGWE